MPNKSNRHRGQNWHSERKNYGDHDDRSEIPRRVSFKPSRLNNKQQRNRDWESTIRLHLEDEDIDMGGTSSGPGHIRYISNKGRGRKGGGRVSSPAPKGAGGRRKLFEGPTNWYKVTLPYGNKYDRDYIMKTLQNHIAPLPLVPYSWRVAGNVSSFFVDDFKVAERLHSADRTITCPDGFKMIIRVHHGLPQVEINAQLKECMKTVMSKRYNPSTKALDLTKFHAAPELGDFFCALFKPVLMLAAIDIIAENIPELEALNLHDNRIQMLEHLKDLKKKLPNLKVLHMGNNKLRQMTNLDPLRGVPIVDLVLDGNPLCDAFKDQSSYVSEVRKRFPKVIKLDGVDLPPPISFDLEEEIQLPKAQQTFLCAQEGQEIVRQFLEQYFVIYDGESRQPLLQAYHEQAMFSMTMAYPYGMTAKNSSWLNWYQTDNRNLIRVQDPERRNRLLRQGHLAVVSFLSEMPKTKHDIHSFTVDLSIFTPQLLMLSVTGIFKELESGQKTAPVRSFSRALLIAPAGSGFCIVNDQLHVTNATEAQAKLAFKTPTVTPAMPPPGAPAAVPAIGAPAPAPVPDDATKQQMVQTMAQQSGMNLEFSAKCLEETNWDFQRAVFIFTELHKQGTIPAEAFVK